jgi:aspartate ammonia-lyase
MSQASIGLFEPFFQRCERVYQLTVGGTAVGTGINSPPGLAETAASEAEILGRKLAPSGAKIQNEAKFRPSSVVSYFMSKYLADGHMQRIGEVGI